MPQRLRLARPIKFYYHRLKAKAPGSHESLMMAISNVLHCVTDSRSLMYAFKVNNVPLNEFDDIVSECKSLLISDFDIEVLFVWRQINKIAYSIVKSSLFDLNLHTLQNVSPILYF